MMPSAVIQTKVPVAAPTFNGNPPPLLTEGHPDPETVKRQKEGFVRQLDDQLQQGSVALDSQVKQERDMITAQAQQQKLHYFSQVDAQVRLQEMQLDQEYQQQLMRIRQQAMRQRQVLEQQALQLTYDWQEKKAQEDMLATNFALKREQVSIQERMAAAQPRVIVQSPAPRPYQPPPAAPAYATSSYVPPVTTQVNQPVTTYTTSSYVPPQVASYTTSSYVPPVAQPYSTGSYVPPTTNTATQMMPNILPQTTPTTITTPTTVTQPLPMTTVPQPLPMTTAALNYPTTALGTASLPAMAPNMTYSVVPTSYTVG